ncbi:MAG TPA: Gfo/Idh/MocA family oxidoreductase [Gemmatimonadaceae bacterium]|nr:Gfo/Idh/MocA family oxidoreductase [Gemmatimonadaceae bacterium]
MAPSDSTCDRRAFLKTAGAAGAAGIFAATRPSPLFAFPSAPNDRVVVAIMGLNSRGEVHLQNFPVARNAEVAYVCDVDSRLLGKGVEMVSKLQSRAPKPIADFRRALDDKDVDALVIAAPDHWHAPAALLALAAGKHVYVEKPCGHNPREGEWLVAAQRRYGRVVQMGNQQRSAPRSIEAVEMIRSGAIGRPYLARAWYANRRDTIGRGKVAPVPSWLDWELWQGPAPRTQFRDNVVHYNWHWFARWGTGELANNGTHEIDVCRWALGVDYPVKVTSAGGRYAFEDDWEFPDTQEVTFEFPDRKALVWQGQSCNSFTPNGKGRGSTIHGTTGTIFVDRSGYTLYDAKNKVVKESYGDEKGDGLDTRAPDRLTGLHIANFLDAVRTGAKQHSPIEEGHKSVLLCHLGNIAQRVGRALLVDPANGRVIGDEDARQLWSREYAPGWEPAPDVVRAAGG